MDHSPEQVTKSHTSFRRKQRAANDWRISLNSSHGIQQIVLPMLVVVLLLLSSVIQQTHQRSHQNQNVPFKTSFVSTSDYLPIRRNGALISLPFANLEQNSSPEQLMISASSYEPIAEEETMGSELKFASKRNQQTSEAALPQAESAASGQSTRRQSSEVVEDLVALSSGETNTSFLDVTLAQPNGTENTNKQQQPATTTTLSPPKTTTIFTNQSVPITTATIAAVTTTTTTAATTTTATAVTSTPASTTNLVIQSTTTQAPTTTTTNQQISTTTIIPTTTISSTEASTTHASGTTSTSVQEKTTTVSAEDTSTTARADLQNTQSTESLVSTTNAPTTTTSIAQSRQDVTTTTSDHNKSRESAGRSQSLPCNFGESNCSYLVATVPVLEKSKTGNHTRLVNEFVFVPEDPEIALEDSSYSTKKPGAIDVDPATMMAEHRTLGGDDNSGDDLELDYVTSDQEPYNGRAGDANLSSPPKAPEAILATTTSTTSKPHLTNRSGDRPPVTEDLARIAPLAAGSRLTQPSVDMSVLRNNATRSSQSTSFTIRLIPSQQQNGKSNQSTQSPVSMSTTSEPTTTTTTKAITPATTTVNMSNATPTMTSTIIDTSTATTKTVLPVSFRNPTTTAAPAPTTRRSIHGARLNQKILRISDNKPQTGDVRQQTASQTTTTTSTTRPTTALSYRKPKQSSEHRQFFSEPAGGDIRRRVPSSKFKQTSSEDDDASILARYTVASQLTRLSANGAQTADKSTGRRAVWSSSRGQASRAAPQIILSSDPSLIEAKFIPTTTTTIPRTTTSTTSTTTPPPTTTATPPTTTTTTTTTTTSTTSTPTRPIPANQAATTEPIVKNESLLNEYPNGPSLSNLRQHLPITANLTTAQILVTNSYRSANTSGAIHPVPVTSGANGSTENKRVKQQHVPIPQQLLHQPQPQPQPQLIMGAESSAALVAQLIGQRLADEVMTLIADTAATAEQQAQTPTLQSGNREPIPVSHPATVHSFQSSTTSSPSLGNNLLESKVRRLIDEVDEYEGSIEDQLARDALHYQAPGAKKPATVTKQRGRQQADKLTSVNVSRQQVNTAAAVDSGKWQADTDTDYSSTSTSALLGSDGDNGNQANLLPGRPGIDYPIHWQVPKTSFDCRNYEQSGFYADVESDCQAYHSCHKGRGGRHTFLCPNGTLFSQELLTCDWWYNVECSASKLYLTSENAVNNNIVESARAALATGNDDESTKVDGAVNQRRA